MATSRIQASKRRRVTATPWSGYVRPARAGRSTRRPVGPTTTISPTSRPAGGARPSDASNANARGPTRSPHALSRANVALSTKRHPGTATGQHEGRRAAGRSRADHHGVVGCLATAPPGRCTHGVFSTRRAPDASCCHSDPTVGVRPVAVRRSPRSLRPPGRGAVARPGPTVAARDDRSRRDGPTLPWCSMSPPARLVSRSGWPTAPTPGSSAST